MYWDVGNLYGWAMSQKLPSDGFKCKKKKSRLTQKLIQNYDGDSDGYMLVVNVSYTKRLQKIHSDLPFLPERMKINKYQKLECNTYEKKNYVEHMKALKLAFDYGLILEKMHRLIKFNREV